MPIWGGAVMIRMLVVTALLLELGACAAFSTSPEAANERVRQLCYVQHQPEWVQIRPPENAQAYRDAWTRGAAGHEPFRGVYVAPRWPEDEFWFRNASGVVKLCAGNPFYHEERCGAGTTANFTETEGSLVASNYEEAICVL